MAKIERKYLAHFLNAAKPGAESPVFERLGKDLEEFGVEMAAQVETKKNILGESSVMISGYEKTSSVEPYYAEEGTALFERLQGILDNASVLDELKTDVVEVKLWNSTQEGVYPAVLEQAYIEITSYGGATTGYQIPFKLHYTGNRQHGTFNVATKTFTATEN